MNATPPSPPLPLRTLACRERSVALGGGPQLVGILNVTPDSFYDGGRHDTLAAALARAETLVAEGAAMLDVGGQSTRPGHAEVSPEEELARVVPVLAAFAGRGDVPLSVDTYKPAVARAALAAGAHVLNDIHGLQRAPELAHLAAEFGAAVIAMHFEPDFQNAGAATMDRMHAYFARTLAIAARAGLPAERLVLDPGIGFGKTQEQNLEILGRLGELRVHGCPLLLGASRKSVIAHVLGLPPDERLEGTLATSALAAWQGVEFLRVHDVAANLRAARMAAAIRRAAGPASSQ